VPGPRLFAFDHFPSQIITGLEECEGRPCLQAHAQEHAHARARAHAPPRGHTHTHTHTDRHTQTTLAGRISPSNVHIITTVLCLLITSFEQPLRLPTTYQRLSHSRKKQQVGSYHAERCELPGCIRLCVHLHTHPKQVNTPTRIDGMRRVRSDSFAKRCVLPGGIGNLK
jgi:hypothetical protein